MSLHNYGWLQGWVGALRLSTLWIIKSSYRSKILDRNKIVWTLPWTWRMGWRLGRWGIRE